MLGATTVPARAGEPVIDRVTMRASDGTELGGWVLRPPGSTGKRLPTVLISTPYFGQCILGGMLGAPCWHTPETREHRAEHPEPVDLLVENGYAVAWFSVRGTGVSRGCMDDMGPREQRDQRELVGWVTRQPWSNGDVGMMGLSYMSQTALAAAVTGHPALKTVVVSGINANLYRFFHSPQGLAYSYALFSEPTFTADVSLLPPGLARRDPALVAGRLEAHRERGCPRLVNAMAQPTLSMAGKRRARFWRKRRISHRYDDIRASVLVAQGFDDLFYSGHAMQDDTIWGDLQTDKAMYLGQWGHSYPYMTGHRRPGHPERADLREDWHATLLTWLDHYLRRGRKPAIRGRVRYEDQSGAWRASKAWPPKESREQALFLRSDGTLGSSPPAVRAAQAFRSVPDLSRASNKAALLCPGTADALTGAQSLVYATAPATQRTVVAGNPMAYLDLAADQSGGGFQVLLYDLPPGFDCADPSGARPLTIGGADLRFHRGGFTPRPFSAGHVRVDLASVAEVIEPGHRLAMAVGYGDTDEHAEIGHFPLITLRSGPSAASSQLVVPVVEGGFGGSSPAVTFPPRP